MRVAPLLFTTAVLFAVAAIVVHGKVCAAVALVSLALSGVMWLFDFRIEVSRA